MAICARQVLACIPLRRTNTERVVACTPSVQTVSSRPPSKVTRGVRSTASVAVSNMTTLNVYYCVIFMRFMRVCSYDHKKNPKTLNRTLKILDGSKEQTKKTTAFQINTCFFLHVRGTTTTTTNALPYRSAKSLFLHTVCNAMHLFSFFRLKPPLQSSKKLNKKTVQEMLTFLRPYEPDLADTTRGNHKTPLYDSLLYCTTVVKNTRPSSSSQTSRTCNAQKRCHRDRLGVVHEIGRSVKQRVPRPHNAAQREGVQDCGEHLSCF